MDALTRRPASAPKAVRERADAPRDVWPDPETRARLILLRLPGVGDATAQRLVDHFGTATAALAAPQRQVAALAGDEAARARIDPALGARVDAGLAWCREHDVRVVRRGVEGYPGRLLHLPDPPAVVLLLGDVRLLDRPAVALVGSRRSTASGRRTAGRLAQGLVARGVVVVSGLALGIDGAAHRAALDAGGDTVAVLGTGPDRPHPPSNRGLFGAIRERGLLVSEFLPGEPPLPHHFPRRNRILAALADAVVVVEAGRRSGALITAGHALDLGLPVGAVPGSVYAETSAGTNRLIQDGAAPVLEPEDALGLLPSGLLDREATDGGRGGEAEPGSDVAADRRAGDSHGPGGPARTGPGRPPSGDAGTVWALLGAEAMGVDELARDAGLPTPRVLAALTGLELAGRAVRVAGARFRLPDG